MSSCLFFIMVRLSYVASANVTLRGVRYVKVWWSLEQ